MRVEQLMNDKPEYLEADASIGEAVMRMREHDRGFEPVGKDNKLIGVITDRDVALRGMVDGKLPDDPVSSILSEKVLYCYQSDDIDDVLKNMGQQNVQRLIVLNNDSEKNFLGVISLSDIANKCENDEMARSIVSCCRSYH